MTDIAKISPWVARPGRSGRANIIVCGWCGVRDSARSYESHESDCEWLAAERAATNRPPPLSRPANE